MACQSPISPSELVKMIGMTWDLGQNHVNEVIFVGADQTFKYSDEIGERPRNGDSTATTVKKITTFT